MANRYIPAACSVCIVYNHALTLGDEVRFIAVRLSPHPDPSGDLGRTHLAVSCGTLRRIAVPLMLYTNQRET